jgi:two-component system, NarL family, nitrate/nitrite response regulator NarL
VDLHETVIRSDSRAIRVFAITRVKILREGLAEMLRRSPTPFLVQAARSIDGNAPEQLATDPDIVILNLADKDWDKSARTALRTFPRTRLVAIGADESEDQVDACAASGISGYLSSDGSTDELVATIEGLARNEIPCSPSIAKALVRRVTILVSRPLRNPIGLTRREQEVVGCLRENLSNKEIARRLGIEVATVKNHVHSVLLKLAVHHRGDSAILNFDANQPIPRSSQPG